MCDGLTDVQVSVGQDVVALRLELPVSGVRGTLIGDTNPDITHSLSLGYACVIQRRGFA